MTNNGLYSPGPLGTLHSKVQNIPPNSRAYLNHGLSIRPDVVEADIWITGDGRGILCHDREFIKDGIKYDLTRLNWKELKILNPEFISLSEFLEYGKSNNLFLNLDMKDLCVADAIIRELKDSGRWQDVIVSGCFAPELRYLRRHMPELRAALNVEDPRLDCPETEYESLVREILKEASELGACALNVDKTYLRQSFVDTARFLGFPVMVWTVDDPCEIETFWQMGVSSITSNRVELIMSKKQEHSQ